jgi:dihydrofolate reductase
MIITTGAGLQGMGKVTNHISISLDGFVAGPNQSNDDPLGEGGERLHEWAFTTDSEVDREVRARITSGNGAYIMGRNMFGAGRGEWDESWTGWWGDDPPYHAPVYVLTHHARESVQMEGGTTFHFVTDGIESALERARADAGELDVSIGGGASTVQQYLAAGLLDELHLHVAPVFLGSGERLFENHGDPVLEPIEVVHSPLATHVSYRVRH